MKASDIVEDALQLRGILQKELAERVGQDHKCLSRKLRSNSIKAQELIDLTHELGYEIKLVDCQGNGQTVSVRRRGTRGPRVKRMAGGIIYDTAKSDALCHTDVEDGRYMELYQDPEGRFFIVHYSFWRKEDATITPCQEDEARHLFEKYADGTVEFPDTDTSRK